MRRLHNRYTPKMTKAEFSPPELARLEKAGALLLAAEDKLPVLARTAWPPELAERFLAGGARELPQPVYTVLDPAATFAATAAARRLVRGDSAVHRWLLRLADTVDDTARLLAGLGTAAMLEPAQRLYGYPQKPLADGKATALELARRLDSLLGAFRDPATLAGERPQFTAQQVKARLDAELPRYFGAAAPLVEVTPHLSAKATAGKNIIRLRATAVYSDLDTTQLLQHEALVHIATGKNGRRQAHFPILGEAHPGNTRTQEGLAVFAEFLSGALDPQRLKRLADRVIAIQMALDGADFIQLYQYFLEVSENEYEAFESARRVVRGGLVTGGAPLTKDVVYVQGLLEVHSFLRAAVQAGDPSLARLLFVGKFDLADLDAMRLLREAGLLVEPQFMPPWVTDLRFLTSYLAYSVFLNEINLGSVLARYRDVFAAG
jgi:uncharacterized protein (TIGR02421 family)